MRSNGQIYKPPDLSTISFGLPRNRSCNTTIDPCSNNVIEHRPPKACRQNVFIGQKYWTTLGAKIDARNIKLTATGRVKNKHTLPPVVTLKKSKKTPDKNG